MFLKEWKAAINNLSSFSNLLPDSSTNQNSLSGFDSNQNSMSIFDSQNSSQNPISGFELTNQNQESGLSNSDLLNDFLGSSNKPVVEKGLFSI